MAPDTMVAEVAQNTVWKIRKPSIGRPFWMMRSMASRSKICGVPNTSPTPNISPNPMNQKRMEPTMKSTKFFIRMLAVFLLRVNPASTRANPGCMKNTSIAASSIHTVLIPVDNSEILSTVPASSGEVCAAAINGKRSKKRGMRVLRYALCTPSLNSFIIFTFLINTCVDNLPSGLFFLLGIVE